MGGKEQPGARTAREGRHHPGFGSAWRMDSPRSPLRASLARRPLLPPSCFPWTHSPWWPRGSLSPPRWFFSEGHVSRLLLFWAVGRTPTRELLRWVGARGEVGCARWCEGGPALSAAGGVSASSREAWGGWGACLHCSLCSWVFNKLAKLTSLGLRPLLLNQVEWGDCLLNPTSPLYLEGLPRAGAGVLGTGEALREEG